MDCLAPANDFSSYTSDSEVEFFFFELGEHNRPGRKPSVSFVIGTAVINIRTYPQWQSETFIQPSLCRVFIFSGHRAKPLAQADSDSRGQRATAPNLKLFEGGNPANPPDEKSRIVLPPETGERVTLDRLRLEVAPWPGLNRRRPSQSIV